MNKVGYMLRFLIERIQRWFRSEPGQADRFIAFISYRHVDPDRRWAVWLHGTLETFRIPRALRAHLGGRRRLGRVFRDEEELAASPHLSDDIEQALDRSEWLLVVCSPRAKESQWVAAEVEYFKKLGRSKRILALLIEGEPTTAFPAPLYSLRQDSGGGHLLRQDEPLAADVRPTNDSRARQDRRLAKLKLAAAMLDCRFDELRQREQQRLLRRLAVLAAVVSAVLVIVAGLGVLAELNRREARRLYVDERRASYLNRIALADRYKQEGQLQESENVLGECTIDDHCCWEWRHLKRLLRTELFAFNHPSGGILGLGFASGTPARLVSLGQDGSLRFWEIGVREPVHTALSKGQAGIGFFTLSKAGRFAIIDEEGTLRLWDNEEVNGQVLCTRCVAMEGVSALSDDGRRVTTIEDNKVRLLEVDSGRELLVLPEDRYQKVAFFPDGNAIVTLTGSPRFVDDGRVGTLALWRVEKHTPEGELQLWDVNDFAVSPHGGLVAIATEGGPVLWNLSDGSHIELPSERRPAKFVLLAPDGDRLAVAVPDGTIDIWSVAEKRLLHSLRVSSGGTGHMAFSPDGRALATSDGDIVRIWDATTMQSAVTVAHSTFEPHTVTSPSGQTTSFTGLSDYVPEVEATVSADGRYIAAKGRSVIVYDAATAREVLHSDFQLSYGRVSLAPTGGLLAIYTRSLLDADNSPAGRKGSTVRFVELPAGLEKHWTPADAVVVDNLEFGPDGRSFVTLGTDQSGVGRLLMWSLEDERPPRLVAEGKGLGPALAYSRHNRLIAAVADADGKVVRIWNAKTGRQIADVPRVPRDITALALGGADDELLAVAGADGELRVWNARQGLELFSVHAELGKVTSVLVTADGNRVLTGGANGDIRVFYVPTGRELFVLRGHSAAVSSLAFTGDENALISTSRDGVVKAWPSDFPANGPPGLEWFRRYTAFVERAPAWHLARAKDAMYRSARAASFHLDQISPVQLREAPFLVRIAQAEAKLGRWERAWATLSKAAEIGALPPWVVFQRALLAVRLGHQVEFQRLCELMLEQAERAQTSADVAALAVRTCVLSPMELGTPNTNEHSLPRRIVAVASVLPPPSQYERSRLGPALYRSGEGASTLADFKKSNDRTTAGLLWDEYDRLFFALTLYATGDREAARKEAKRASRDLGRKDASGLAWDDRLEFDLLSGEVARAIR